MKMIRSSKISLTIFFIIFLGCFSSRNLNNTLQNIDSINRKLKISTLECFDSLITSGSGNLIKFKWLREQISLSSDCGPRKHFFSQLQKCCWKDIKSYELYLIEIYNEGEVPFWNFYVFLIDGKSSTLFSIYVNGDISKLTCKNEADRLDIIAFYKSIVTDPNILEIPWLVSHISPSNIETKIIFAGRELEDKLKNILNDCQ